MKIKTLDEIIKEYVLYILNNSETQREAAKLLGVSERTITNYLRKWGLTFDKWEHRPKQSPPPTYSPDPVCPHCGTPVLPCGYKWAQRLSIN